MIRSAHGLDRREFVRSVSTGLALLPVLGAEGLAQAPAPRRSRVALVRTSDRKRGVTEVLKLFDPRNIAGKRVVLKPNFNTADETPGSTHNDTLAQLVTELHERGRAQRHARRVERAAPTRGRPGAQGDLRPRPRPAVRRRRLRRDRRAATGCRSRPPGRTGRTGSSCRAWWSTRSTRSRPAASRPTVRRRLHDVAQAGRRAHPQADPMRRCTPRPTCGG